MRRVLLAAPLLLLAAAASAGDSPLAGTPASAGDRIYGSVDGPHDRDPFLLEAAEGARLSVLVKGRGKAPLLPTLEVLDPEGASLDLSLALRGESTTAVSLDDLRVPSSGTWTVVVAGYLGAAGDYQAAISVAADTKILETVTVPAGQEVRCEFTAWSGTLASYVASETSGPPLAGVHICCPHDNPIAGTEAVRTRRGLAASRLPLDRGPGRYRIVLQGSPSGETTVDLRTALKFPKASKRRIRLGAEPRPQSIAPPTGRDGTSFTISGTGFTGESRVIFHGAYSAEDVALGPDGGLAGHVPSCPAATAGGAVEVAVLNPDGQFGTLSQTFTFLGVPAPAWADPMASPLEGGVSVAVHGREFRPGASVTLGGTPAADVQVRNGALLTFVAPAHAPGPVDLVVVDEFGREGIHLPDFQYADPPSVASADPSSIPSFGGRTVTLAGSEFIPGDRVFVAGVEATGVSVVSRTSLRFVAPPAESGDATLEVRDPLGRSWRGPGILALTPSFQDVTGTALPAAAPGSEFAGDSVALGDLDLDGSPDIVVSAAVPSVNWITGQTETATRFLRNGGNGKFSDANWTLFPGLRDPGDHGQADALSLGDLDGDGGVETLLSREAVLPSRDAAGRYDGYPAYYHMGDSADFDPPTLSATRLFARSSSGPFLDETDDRVVDSRSTPALGMGDRWQASASALGDLDGDGDADLLVVAKGRVQMGYPTAMEWTYVKKGSYYYGYYYVRDKVTITEGAFPTGSTRALLGDGAGSLPYAAWTPYPILASDGRTVLDDFSGEACAVGDLDGDGVGDAIVLASEPVRREDAGGSAVPASALRVLDGAWWGGMYFDPYAIPAPYADDHAGSGDFWQGDAVAAGDLDGDGDLDLVLGRERVGYWTDSGGTARLLPALRILRNDGSGAFLEDTAGFLDEDLFRAPGEGTILGVRSLALLDLDGDGSLDLVTTGRESRVTDAGNGRGPFGLLPAGTRMATRVLLNDGSGRLSDATADRFPAPSGGDGLAGDALALADLDGNGTPDLVIVAASPTAAGKRPVRILLTK